MFMVDFPHLRQKLESLIKNRTGGRVKNLAVQLSPDGVVLEGHTDTFYVKQLAQHGVREVLPEAPLQNAIVVA